MITHLTMVREFDEEECTNYVGGYGPLTARRRAADLLSIYAGARIILELEDESERIVETTYPILASDLPDTVESLGLDDIVIFERITDPAERPSDKRLRVWREGGENRSGIVGKCYNVEGRVIM